MKRSRVITIVLCVMLLAGCSAKSSYMKKGAIAGGVIGAGTVVAIGTKDINSRYAGAIAVVVVVVGLAGVAAGAGVGYLIDEASRHKRDRRMQKMIQSQQLQGL